MHAGAAERIDADANAGAADGVDVDHVAEIADVGVEEIVACVVAALQRLRVAACAARPSARSSSSAFAASSIQPVTSRVGRAAVAAGCT